MVGQDKVPQTVFCDVEGEQLFDFVLFGYALVDLVEGNVEAGEEAEFGVGGCQVVEDAETVLLRDIGGLDACFFAYFAADGREGVRVCRTCRTCRSCCKCFRCVEVAFKETADDVVAPGVDVYVLSFVE